MKHEDRITNSLIVAYGLDEPVWVTLARWIAKAFCLYGAYRFFMS